MGVTQRGSGWSHDGAVQVLVKKQTTCAGASFVG